MKLIDKVWSAEAPQETEVNIDTAYRRTNIHTIEHDGATIYEYTEEQYTLPEYYGIIIPQMQAEIAALREQLEGDTDGLNND